MAVITDLVDESQCCALSQSEAISCPPGEEIPYLFGNASLLGEALAAASVFSKPEGNKRLASIEDAALRLVLYIYNYDRDWSTGESKIYLI